MDNHLTFADVVNKIHSIAPDAIVFPNRDNWNVHVYLLNINYEKNGNSDLMLEHANEIREYFKMGTRCVIEQSDHRLEICSTFFVDYDNTIVVR